MQQVYLAKIHPHIKKNSFRKKLTSMNSIKFEDKIQSTLRSLSNFL